MHSRNLSLCKVLTIIADTVDYYLIEIPLCSSCTFIIFFYCLLLECVALGTASATFLTCMTLNVCYLMCCCVPDTILAIINIFTCCLFAVAFLGLYYTYRNYIKIVRYKLTFYYALFYCV